MRKLFVLAVLAVAVSAAAVPTVANAAVACSNKFQVAPDFPAINDTAFFQLNTFPFTNGAAWVYKSGITAPWAILTSTLPATSTAQPFFKNFAGTYTLVCNLDTGWTPGFVATTGWVDANGAPFPSGAPFISGGVGIPGIFRIAAK